MKIKIDAADKAFSEYIRLRDGECVRCHKLGAGDKGIIGLQASHYFGRGAESTRFDPNNVDSLCWPCHIKWGSEQREEYREFKVRQLGKNGFKMLTLASNLFAKKDRKMSLIRVKLLLKDLNDKS